MAVPGAGVAVVGTRVQVPGGAQATTVTSLLASQDDGLLPVVVVVCELGSVEV